MNAIVGSMVVLHACVARSPCRTCRSLPLSSCGRPSTARAAPARSTIPLRQLTRLRDRAVVPNPSGVRFCLQDGAVVAIDCTTASSDTALFDAAPTARKPQEHRSSGREYEPTISRRESPDTKVQRLPGCGGSAGMATTRMPTMPSADATLGLSTKRTRSGNQRQRMLTTAMHPSNALPSGYARSLTGADKAHRAMR